ncbi:DMT family transporter [Tabrizicola flagellatus]|uniref:DMT family transporter n=1 Tax=Tabrizicola flagellatus TaxID=2593021 RepID=UPI0011F3FD64|nr:DMT family transporter [Tabrizicola flagellatus]
MATAAQGAPAVVEAHRQGVLLLLASTLAWSTSGLFARAIPLDTPTVILWRGLAGAAGLVVVLLWLRGRQGFGDFVRLGPAGWGYALCSGLGMLFFVGSLKATSIAHVAIIYATLPFVAAFLGWWLLREAPGRAGLAAAGLALAGATIMVGLGGDGTLIGDAMAFGMVLAMAGMILILRGRPETPTLAAGIVSAIWAPLVMAPFATVEGLTAWNITLLVAFGLVNSTAGLALFILGSRHTSPVETALIGALETALTPVWVWLVFHETPTPPTLVGGAMVMAASVGHILWTARQPAPR